MTTRRHTPAYPAELRERGVRLFRENRAEYASDTAAYKAIAPKLGCSPDSLRVRCQQAEPDIAQHPGLPTSEKDRIKELERENRGLCQANEILKKASAYFAMAETLRRVQAMISYIEDHRVAHGVEPICRVLPIAPSTFHACVAISRDPDLASDRARQDVLDGEKVKEAYDVVVSAMEPGKSGTSCGAMSMTPHAAPPRDL